MAIASLQEFRDFIIDLLKLIVKKGDDQAAELKAKIDGLSTDLTTANETIKGLQAAIADADEAQTQALLEQAAQQVSALDELSTAIAAEFNPTPTADAVASAVEESPQVETPVEVSSSTGVGTPEPTPAAVTDAAVNAIVDAASIY